MKKKEEIKGDSQRIIMVDNISQPSVTTNHHENMKSDNSSSLIQGTAELSSNINSNNILFNNKMEVSSLSFQDISHNSTSKNDDNVPVEGNGRWTQEEHKKFLKGLKIFGKDWFQIQNYIGTRSSA